MNSRTERIDVKSTPKTLRLRLAADNKPLRRLRSGFLRTFVPEQKYDVEDNLLKTYYGYIALRSKFGFYVDFSPFDASSFALCASGVAKAMPDKSEDLFRVTPLAYSRALEAAGVCL